jgi:hypothetical protein
MANYIITLSNNPIPFDYSAPARLTFKFIIYNSSIPPGVDDVTEEHTMIDFDEADIGSEKDDDETIFMPTNMIVEMQLQGSVEFLETVALELATKTTVVQIFKGVDKIFSGYVYQKDVTGYRSTKRIKVTVIDQLKRLEDNSTVFPADFDLPYSYVRTNYFKVKDFILDILTRPETFEDPYIEEVVSLCELEAQVDIGGVLTDVTFDDFADLYGRYFFSNPVYKNELEMIKGILLSYGCVGVVGFDKKFYIVPRKYKGGATYEISKENRMAEPETFMVPRKQTLEIQVLKEFNGSETRFEFARYPRGGIPRDGFDETVIIYGGGGALPQSGDSPLAKTYAYVGATVYPIVDDTYRDKKPDGTYTDRTSLWKLKGDEIWGLISTDRRGYNLNLIGNYSELHPGQFFHFDDLPGRKYRLRKGRYSLKNKRVKASVIDASLELVEQTPAIVLDAMMEAQGGAIEVGGTRYTDSSQLILIYGQPAYAIFDNWFGGAFTSVKRYDGTVIDIPLAQRNEVNQTAELYAVYLAISKAGLEPASAYPVLDDANADWYLYTTAPDQRILDPDFEYKIKLSRILPEKNKKYYLWLGMKSSNAELFPGIPQYSILQGKAKVSPF